MVGCLVVNVDVFPGTLPSKNPFHEGLAFPMSATSRGEEVPPM